MIKLAGNSDKGVTSDYPELTTDTHQKNDSSTCKAANGGIVYILLRSEASVTMTKQLGARSLIPSVMAGSSF